MSSVSNALNKFAVDFFKQLNVASGENLFISPYSIYSALLMTSMGVSGTTYSELSDVLHSTSFSESEEEAIQQFKLFSDRIESHNDSVKLFIGNSIWCKRLLPQYIQRLQTEMNAESYPLTSPDRINRWVSEKTNGKITRIIDAIPSLTISILVNSIYFKGSWNSLFQKTNTHPCEFITPNGSKSVETMQMEANISHFIDPEYTAVELFYAGKSYSMLILMPTTLSLPEFIEQKLSENLHQEVLTKLQSKKKILQLPKFTIEYGPKELKSELSKLGVQGVYSQGEFDRMSDDPTAHVDEILHKAICIVNEEGTEAAAVTVVRARKKSKVSHTPYIKIKKPFFFLILEKKQNSIIFCGTISDPSNSQQ